MWRLIDEGFAASEKHIKIPRGRARSNYLSKHLLAVTKLFLFLFIAYRNMTEFTETDIPFDSLPLDPTGPPGNAWGRFGKDDQLGTLNLLTPERVVEAAKEIRTGVRISLDWPLSMPSHPSFNRDPFKQEIVLRSPNCIFDDILSFNSQGSTQWDGFRHYGISSERWSSTILTHYSESTIQAVL